MKQIHYVTTEMVANHAGVTTSTVRKALLRAKVEPEPVTGCQGKRYDMVKVNKVILLNWPASGAMKPYTVAA